MASRTSAWIKYEDHSRLLTSIGAWTPTTCKQQRLISISCSGTSRRWRPNEVRLWWKMSSGWRRTALSASWWAACGATDTIHHSPPSSPQLIVRVDTTFLQAATLKDICDFTSENWFLLSQLSPSLIYMKLNVTTWFSIKICKCNSRYPCITPRAEFIEAKVYSGTIACARFLYGNRSLVTVGGTDASLMIWELAGELDGEQFKIRVKSIRLN